MATPDLYAINLPQRLALSDRGDLMPLDKLFDSEGDETDVISEAVSFSAGPDPRDGLWYAGRVDAFETKRAH